MLRWWSVLPVPAVVRNMGAIALGEVAPQKAADHRTADAKNHESDSAHDVACEIWIQEDGNSGIHQNRQHNSKNAFGHVLPPVQMPSASINALNADVRGSRYRTYYSNQAILDQCFLGFAANEPITSGVNAVRTGAFVSSSYYAHRQHSA